MDQYTSNLLNEKKQDQEDYIKYDTLYKSSTQAKLQRERDMLLSNSEYVHFLK